MSLAPILALRQGKRDVLLRIETHWESLEIAAILQVLPSNRTGESVPPNSAVRHLLTASELTHAPALLLDLEGLERYERPLPRMKEYDLLLSSAEVTS